MSDSNDILSNIIYAFRSPHSKQSGVRSSHCCRASKQKLSQRDVARELGVTQAWVSRVERGQQKAWIGQVLRLAAWLEINPTFAIRRGF